MPRVRRRPSALVHFQPRQDQYAGRYALRPARASAAAHPPCRSTRKSPPPAPAFRHRARAEAEYVKPGGWPCTDPAPAWSIGVRSGPPDRRGRSAPGLPAEPPRARPLHSPHSQVRGFQALPSISSSRAARRRPQGRKSAMSMRANRAERAASSSVRFCTQPCAKPRGPACWPYAGARRWCQPPDLDHISQGENLRQQARLPLFGIELQKIPPGAVMRHNQQSGTGTAAAANLPARLSDRAEKAAAREKSERANGSS